MPLTEDEIHKISTATAEGIAAKMPDVSTARPTDRYRPTIQFLSGLLAAELALMVGLFAALEPDGTAADAINTLVTRSLMLVLVASIVTTGVMAWAQYGRATAGNDDVPGRWMLCVPCGAAVLVMGLITWQAWALADL